MTENTEFPTGVYLSNLDTGSAVDLETKSRHYRIEYLEGDRIRISGHPRWCPTPVLARLHGSRVGLGEFEGRMMPVSLRIHRKFLSSNSSQAPSNPGNNDPAVTPM